MPRVVMQLEFERVRVCLMGGIVAFDTRGYNVTFQACNENGIGWHQARPARNLPRESLACGVRIFNEAVRDVVQGRITHTSLMKELEERYQTVRRHP